MYIFNPPTVDEGPLGPDRLSQFYTLPRGISVLKENGRFYQTRYPSTDQINRAEVTYLGGYVHKITDEAAAELAAAGYSEYLTEIE